MRILNNYILKLHDIYLKTGVSGINKYIDNLESKNFFIKFLLKIEGKLFGYRRFMRTIEEYEEEIEGLGLKIATEHFLNRLGYEVNVKGTIPEWTKHSGIPVLFYGNHLTFIEPLALFSIFKRQDTIFLGNNIVKSIGHGIGSHILPLTASKYGYDSNQRLSLYHEIFDKGQNLSVKQIKSKNEKTLKKAATLLLRGCAIGIFPAGATKKINKWYEGIARVIRFIPEKDCKGILLAPIYVEGPDKKLFFKRLKSTYPSQYLVNVQFGDPFMLHEKITREFREDKILDILKKEYFEEFKLNKE